MLRSKHAAATSVAHSLQKRTTKKLKMSALATLALLIPTLAMVALMFSMLSVIPTKSALDPQREVQSVVEEDKSGKKLAPGTAKDQKERELLVEQQQPKPESTSDDVEYHIIFSTGCSIFQDWQSYVFFYHAMVSNQPGTVTRIVSGCSEEEEGILTILYEDQIAKMAPGRFRIHFTPDYSRQKQGHTYKYWNKPFGTRHWMEHALGFPDNPQNENAIVVLLDPDQIILRPYRNNDFSNTQWSFLKKGQEPRTRIEHGKPMGQYYAFSLEWKRKVNMSLVVLPNEKSPVDEMSDEEARVGYIVGPPYIATARDMYAIVTKWCEFALPVHDQYPHLLAEMFAYCLAAAHLRLAHQLAKSFMVSDVETGPRSEGWWYIDKLPESDLCRSDDPELLPNVLHFCQHYAIGNYFFGKYRMPKNFLSCEHPLFAEPPPNFFDVWIQAIGPGIGQSKQLQKQQAKKNAFMVCHMILALNSAAEYFKQKHCIGKGNFNKTFFL